MRNCEPPTSQIVCAGVRVEPGDVIVADGDGVVVAPQAIAAEVARRAKRILDQDKVARRRLYEQLGWAPDASVTIE